MNVQLEPICYDPQRMFLQGRGVSEQDVEKLAPRLDTAKVDVLKDLQLWTEGGSVPDHKEPLDAGFIDLPERLLRDYRSHKESVN